MYGTAGLGALFLPLIILLIISLCCTSAFVELAVEKGHSGKTTTIWLLGIFGSVLAAGLYVAALPDRAGVPSSPSPKTVDDELPSL